MKHITLLFVTISLFFANIGSAYSSFATSDFEENEEDIQIIDTGVIYAGQKLHGILNYETVASLICFNFLLCFHLEILAIFSLILSILG